MTDEQYNEIKKLLEQAVNNQVILGNKLNAIQADVETAINNTKILGRDQDVIMEDLKRVKRALKI